MSPEQAAAWDLERATIVAEGEQWRQLFSNLSHDYESLNTQLNEAKTMVTVLGDDLKERDDKIATYAKLEQEYTRSTIYLEDQLRGSRERVSYLEAEFQALDAYRHQMKRN
jgi:chromosome segregation ATPase